MRKACLLLALFLSGLRADEAAPTLRLLVFTQPYRGILTQDTDLREIPSRLLYLREDQSAVHLHLRRNGHSEIVELPRGQVLRLHKPTAEGVPGDLVLEYSFPAEWKNALIVLDPDAEAEDGRMAFEVFNTSPERLAVGANLFRNELEHIVKLHIGGTDHFLDPGAEISLRLTEPRARFSLEEQSGKSSRRYTGAVHRSEKSGVLHILRPDPDSGRRIRVLTFQASI